MDVDFLVVGAGVVGLATAWRLASRHPDARIVVLDKEDRVGRHASGRNSGVLHAGFYYAEDSLKARFSAAGVVAWKAFCREHGLPLREGGKLVVARREADHHVLDDLLRRAEVNGVRLEAVDEAEAQAIEPRVRTLGRALFSPSTATVDPERIMMQLVSVVREAGVDVRFGQAFVGRVGTCVRTSAGPIDAGFVVNCAGMYADRVAHAYGAGQRWRLVAFKGTYLVARAGPPLACCVYPAPDPELPFLGVHFTPTPDGRTLIGPTATPARFREDTGDRPDRRGFPLGEVLDQAWAQISLWWSDPGVRRSVWSEAPKLSRRALVTQGAELLDDVRLADYRWGRPGIRAQLVDRTTGRLHFDFVVEEAERSLHVLNAVSPAFTCALPFAEHLVSRIDDRMAA